MTRQNMAASRASRSAFLSRMNVDQKHHYLTMWLGESKTGREPAGEKLNNDLQVVIR